MFFEPDKLKPGVTREAITTEAAKQIAQIAQKLRERGLEPHSVARFLDRLVFCLFAEDVGLLPKDLFTRILEKTKNDPGHFSKLMGELFSAMAEGGDFGLETIKHFNGNLFDDGSVLDLTASEIESVRRAAKLDWGAVDPSIFGTLFERGLDPDKRSQLGAHYTSREDIQTLVEPVVMQPLRREWDFVREQAEKLAKRTLTNLYNLRPTWLDLAHRKLDEAVFAAYGWDAGMSDEEILERLLELNLERAGAGGL